MGERTLEWLNQFRRLTIRMSGARISIRSSMRSAAPASASTPSSGSVRNFNNGVGFRGGEHDTRDLKVCSRSNIHRERSEDLSRQLQFAKLCRLELCQTVDIHVMFRFHYQWEDVIPRHRVLFEDCGPPHDIHIAILPVDWWE